MRFSGKIFITHPSEHSSENCKIRIESTNKRLYSYSKVG